VGCPPELVEGSRAEALPTMLRQAQHDSHFLICQGSKDDKAKPQIPLLQLKQREFAIIKPNQVFIYPLYT
jgi:hypothetical protein